jgi:hypothetical protein
VGDTGTDDVVCGTFIITCFTGTHIFPLLSFSPRGFKASSKLNSLL